MISAYRYRIKHFFGFPEKMSHVQESESMLRSRKTKKRVRIMLLTSHMLVNKLFATVYASFSAPQETDVLETTQRTLYQAIQNCFRITPVWKYYAFGGKTDIPENSFKLHTAYMEYEGQRVWAARISAADTLNSRRRWIYHVCLRDSYRNCISLQYARCCYDHTAGSIAIIKGAKHNADALLDAVLNSNHIRIYCGSYPLPMQPVQLSNTSIAVFMRMIFDQPRTIPIMLITCPDIIIPKQAADTTTGNLIVYWCSDKYTLMNLNSLLPSELKVPLNAVKLYMPINSTNVFHPTYTYDSICQMESQAFYSGLYQAFCSSMRSEESRNFLTLEDVAREIERLNTKKILQQLDEKKKQLSTSLEQCKVLSAENTALQENFAIQKQKLEQSENTDYEAWLNEVICENEGLKRDISDLSTQLYSTMGKGFRPDRQNTSAVVQELMHAIYACLACSNSKK